MSFKLHLILADVIFLNEISKKLNIVHYMIKYVRVEMNCELL